MNLRTQVSEIKINITPRVIKSIVGFVELEFKDQKNNVVFKVRGYTIKVKSFGGKDPVFTVDAPAYGSGFKLKKSFIVENKNLYFELEKEILTNFIEMTNGKTPNDYLLEKEEIIIPDDFP